MNKNVLYIKNMVCDRCILAVKEVMEKNHIPLHNITLGEVEIERKLSPDEENILNQHLDKLGFQLIGDRESRLVNRVKSLIIKSVYEDKAFRNKNLSEILKEDLHLDYSHLSSVFTRSEGKSIQHYQQEVKTERIKELLEYDELSIQEIAMDMGYSSPAYLSTQFKKTTGITPSQYRAKHLRSRNSLDSI
ncbi:helix-turn-helix transcriptional regulator [Antarcticibacterium flavum]|uniref:Helix-turn-helix transcriptional regulator n=1 Tax=Antarcticibacterium flavum TaxID=2058175 RepID=A0A5B7X2D0_9FLAO|nr:MULTISPECIES: AraC family transcriptional regulator [Antarcticibacterium]MCM4161024.1 AraC family transcriptional regulator [Antarcticibacterium sp. W02-3]QCY69255.1 helix-turn-helix transcriptional regulator [Antarcticibacterium flavum]